MSKTEITLIQRGLLGLDHNPGPLDGVFGAQTRAAAEAWLAAGGKRAAPAPAVANSNRTIYQGKARHAVREIVVHCSATRPTWLAGHDLYEQVAEIRRWHVQDNGWRDIGYHWIVGRNGSQMAGRAETEIGAGVVGHNNGVIHICLIGGHGSASSDRFRDHFTVPQDERLRALIDGITLRTRIDRISGHNEWAAKACPGFNVPSYLKEAA